MLFAIPLAIAVASAVAIFALLFLVGGATVKRFEGIAVVTTAALALTYVLELTLLHPAVGPIVHGALVPAFHRQGAVLAVVGIVGATIMPHNLFLQAGLTRDALRGVGAPGRDGALKRIIGMTLGALIVATLINAAIEIVGAATHSTTIETAFITLRPVAGYAAATIFGLALIAAAIAATISGACAGDMICLPSSPILLTRFQRRLLAAGPAVAFLLFGISPTNLLVYSQVALGFALPAVVVPLIVLATRERRMQSRPDYALVGISTLVLVAASACDGYVLTTLTH
jgi:manganese transport protein